MTPEDVERLYGPLPDPDPEPDVYYVDDSTWETCPEELYAQREMVELANDGARHLQKRRRRALALAAEGMTLAQIGKRLKVSPERARQLLLEAVGRLRFECKPLHERRLRERAH
jgi:DNA-directed RNA polymerase sigma subunit (sigma70/sigma32)